MRQKDCDNPFLSLILIGRPALSTHLLTTLRNELERYHIHTIDKGPTTLVPFEVVGDIL